MKRRELSKWAKLLIAVIVVTAGWGFYELTALLSTDFLISVGVQDEATRLAILAFGLLGVALGIGYLVGIRKDTIIKDFIK